MSWMHRVLVVASALAALAAAPGASATVTATVSGPDGPAAVVLRLDGRPTVAHADAAGRWHRFTVPGHPFTIELASLEGGGGLAAFDEGDTVEVQTWAPDGTVTPPVTVLSGIQPHWEGSFVAAAWQLASDGRGTVAIAAITSDAGNVVATVRDPGGAFSPQQALGTTGAPPFAPKFDSSAWVVPDLAIAPIGAGGAVTVAWENRVRGEDAGPDPLDPPPIHDEPGVIHGPRRGAQATRPAAGAPFAAATAPAAPLDTLSLFPEGADLSAPPIASFADQSAPIEVGAAIARMCGGQDGCTRPQLFVWGARRMIVFRAGGWRRPWYVAKAGADAVFGAPVKIHAVSPGSLPLWTARPGVVAWASTSRRGNRLRVNALDLRRLLAG